ncbi:2009_t:CDS:2, partial [Dentiscutata erythropus]
MDNEGSTKTCTRCQCVRPNTDFIVGESDIRNRCVACRNNTSQAKKHKRQEANNSITEKENAISFINIADHIYYALLEYKNLNDNLEGQTSFQLQFDIDLDSINENIPIEITKEKNQHIANLIVDAISDGDGYTYVITRKVDTFKLLCYGRQLTSWRKEFQKEWNSLASRPCDLGKYLTNHGYWICSCPYFATNRFFLCKHLVAPIGSKPNAFFYQVLRNSKYPLISLSSVNPWKEIYAICNFYDDNNHKNLINSDNSITINEINTPTINTASEIYETSNSFMDGIEQKYARLHQVLSETFHNPQKFLENMESKLSPLEKFVKDILQHENRHTLPRTWKD